jgi:hypothetical protein
MSDPKVVIAEWIYEELEALGREGTFEEYQKVVENMPEFVTREDVRRIAAEIFGTKGVQNWSKSA